MKELLTNLFKKNEQVVDSDLTPRGVSRTVNDLRADFNTTFVHIKNELERAYKINRLP